MILEDCPKKVGLFTGAVLARGNACNTLERMIEMGNVTKSRLKRYIYDWHVGAAQ